MTVCELGGPRRWRRLMLLCAAPLASATGGATRGAADGRPPAHGAAPLYVSDYGDNRVLRCPPRRRPEPPSPATA